MDCRATCQRVAGQAFASGKKGNLPGAKKPGDLGTFDAWMLGHLPHSYFLPRFPNVAKDRLSNLGVAVTMTEQGLWLTEWQCPSE